MLVIKKIFLGLELPREMWNHFMFPTKDLESVILVDSTDAFKLVFDGSDFKWEKLPIKLPKSINGSALCPIPDDFNLWMAKKTSFSQKVTEINNFNTYQDYVPKLCIHIGEWIVYCTSLKSEHSEAYNESGLHWDVAVCSYHQCPSIHSSFQVNLIIGYTLRISSETSKLTQEVLTSNYFLRIWLEVVYFFQL